MSTASSKSASFKYYKKQNSGFFQRIFSRRSSSQKSVSGDTEGTHDLEHFSVFDNFETDFDAQSDFTTCPHLPPLNNRPEPRAEILSQIGQSEYFRTIDFDSMSPDLRRSSEPLSSPSKPTLPVITYETFSFEYSDINSSMDQRAPIKSIKDIARASSASNEGLDSWICYLTDYFEVSLSTLFKIN